MQDDPAVTPGKTMPPDKGSAEGLLHGLARVHIGSCHLETTGQVKGHMKLISRFREAREQVDPGSGKKGAQILFYDPFRISQKHDYEIRIGKGRYLRSARKKTVPSCGLEIEAEIGKRPQIIQAGHSACHAEEGGMPHLIQCRHQHQGIAEGGGSNDQYLHLSTHYRSLTQAVQLLSFYL
jgi:hypothetical protein